jgi:hypothetical protein
MSIVTSNLFQASVTTSWVKLAPKNATNVSIQNKTGAAILVRTERDKDTEYVTIATGESLSVPVVSNTSEVLIKAASPASGINLISYQTR